MRLVADESCDFGIVRGLRSVGHDVIAIAETRPGIEDDQVLQLARSERRVLVTEDKGFGHVMLSAANKHSGVLLIRYPALARSSFGGALAVLLSERDDSLYSRFECSIECSCRQRESAPLVADCALSRRE
jgi:predicted nuclease of predicted toxin-antitoxin system